MASGSSNASEEKRVKELCEKWYGKAFVGDGADVVEREELDPWQKFAYDIVMSDRASLTAPLRLMLLGSAGTGKSRTLRALVRSRRDRARAELESQLRTARVSREEQQRIADLIEVPSSQVAVALRALDADAMQRATSTEQRVAKAAPGSLGHEAARGVL